MGSRHGCLESCKAKFYRWARSERDAYGAGKHVEHRKSRIPRCIDTVFKQAFMVLGHVARKEIARA